MKLHFYIKRPLEFDHSFRWEFDKYIPSIYDIYSIKEILKINSVFLFSFPFEYKERILIEDLAKELKLKTPFVSYENKKHHNKSFSGNINYIGSPKYESKHIVFGKTTGQAFHVDGTFEEIGAVGTTILCCLNPAYYGGESIFFHATRAFRYFQSKNPELAELFLLPNALRRFNFGYDHERKKESIGPAFAYKKGKLITRFTIDGSADWVYGFQRIEGLKEAFLSFQQFYAVDSPYIKIVKLRKKQGVIFSNALISHGRLAFENHPDSPRVYCRGLFVEDIV